MSIKYTDQIKMVSEDAFMQVRDRTVFSGQNPEDNYFVYSRFVLCSGQDVTGYCEDIQLLAEEKWKKPKKEKDK